MTREAFFAEWSRRAEELEELKARVDPRSLINKMLTELELVLRNEDEELLSLTAAEQLCGYSSDHLGRLVATGKLANYGGKHRPRVRRGELPRKVSDLRNKSMVGIMGVTSTKQIARSVVNSQTNGESR